MADPVHGSARFRRALTEVGEGTQSVAEAGLRDLIVWAKLPLPMFHPRLFVGQTFIAKPDF